MESKPLSCMLILSCYLILGDEMCEKSVTVFDDGGGGVTTPPANVKG